MLFLLSCVLNLIFALSITHLYRPTRWIGWLLGVYLLSWAQIVVCTQTAAAFSMLRTYPVLAIQVLTTLSAIIVWWQWRRHDLPIISKTLQSNWRDFGSQRAQWLRETTHYPLLIVMVLAVVIGAMVSGWLILNVAPTSGDAMRYHLSRVGYWMQHDHLFPFPTNNIRHVTFPINTSLPLYWIADFAHTENLFGFIQWTAYFACIVAIYGSARALRVSRSASIFGALVFATLSNVVMQSGSPRSDLLLTAFCLCTLYFLITGLQQRHTGALILSAISLGIGIGTRPNILFFAPGILIGLGMIWTFQHERRRAIVRWVIACGVCAIVLGSFSYFINLAALGSPVGSISVVGLLRTEDSASPVAEMRTNMARSIFLSIDFSQLPDPIRLPLTDMRNEAFRWLDQALGLEMLIIRNGNFSRANHTLVENSPFDFSRAAPVPFQEGLGGYGLLVPLLIMPAMGRAAWLSIRHRDPYLIMAVAGIVTFWMVTCFFQIYVRSYPRYMMPSIAVGCITVAVAYPAAWLRGIRPFIFVAIGVYVLAATLLFNLDRPLTGSRPITLRTRLEQLTMNDPRWLQPATDVSECVPIRGELGLIYEEHVGDYMYFGRNFSRTLTQLVRQWDGSLLPDPAQRPELRYILAHYLNTESVPSNFTPIRASSDYVLYAREDTPVNCTVSPH